MKAWSWFAIPPLVLAAAYAATPMLVASLTGPRAAAVRIAQPDLPDDTVRPVAAPPAGEGIDYSVFGVMANTGSTTAVSQPVVPVEEEPALQSVLMTDGEGVAVVNGNLVREGDKVGAYRVARIEPRAVTLILTHIRNGKSGTQVPKDELKVLHFPEYRDADMPAMEPGVEPASAAARELEPEQIELEQKYRRILEQLK